MDLQKRKALEAAGYRFTDAATFLGMTEEERALLEARLALAKALRRERQARNLTQKQLAKRIGSSQPRVAKLEQAAPDVSFDLILKALLAVGVRLSVSDCGAGQAATAKQPASGQRARGRRRAKGGPKRSAPTPPLGVSEVTIELVESER